MVNESTAAEEKSLGVPLRFPPEHLLLGLFYSLLAGFGLDLFSGSHKHRGLALWLQILLAHIFFLAQRRPLAFPHLPRPSLLFPSEKKKIEKETKKAGEKWEGMGRGKTYSSQPDELANLPPLLFDGQTLAPLDGARVVPCPLARGALMVKVRNLVQLFVREQPEVEERRGERRVHLAARELH